MPCLALLHDMGKLVCQQPEATWRLRRELSGPEDDVVTHGERPGIDRPGRLGRGTAGVDPDPAEVAAEAGLGDGAYVRRERGTGVTERADPTLHVLGRFRRLTRVAGGLTMQLLLMLLFARSAGSLQGKTGSGRGLEGALLLAVRATALNVADYCPLVLALAMGGPALQAAEQR
jgi:hypothetical protein